jgi:hypothetical protein
MRTLIMLMLIVVALLASNGFRTEAQEKDDLEARVAQLEKRIAELETGVILPGENVRYESTGVTEADGLFLARNRFSLACRMTPLEDALAPDLETTWPLDKWNFLSCVRFPPTMDLQ